MSLWSEMEKKGSYTKTLNGAVTHATSGDACLDMFAVAGGMRYRSESDQVKLFSMAYIENPELAMKLLFHIRDITGGLGERKMFRTLIRYVAKRWPESAKKNVHLIMKFGRWDDLMCLMGTKAEKEVVKVIKEQLAADLEALERRQAGEVDAPISLLAKWLPSINTSSKRTVGQAKVLAKALDMDRDTYRRTLSKLRANIGLTERYLSNKEVRKVKYEAVPGNAMMKYRASFEKHDEKRFNEFLSNVDEKKSIIHCKTLYPYEILRPFFGKTQGWDFHFTRNLVGEKVLNLLWENLGVDVANENAIPVIDTSGSMYCRYGDGPLPALISQAQGIYCSEHCKGLFHNRFITFESNPHVMEIHGENLREKLEFLERAPWGGSTNIEAVFDLILDSAIAAKASQDEMPTVIYIFSDMEFNCAVDDPKKSVYKKAKARYKAAGYEMPAVVFHNVNSWQMQTPVRKDTRGAALTSGAGMASFKAKFDGNVTPMDHMLRVLNSERYKEVHA